MTLPLGVLVQRWKYRPPAGSARGDLLLLLILGGLMFSSGLGLKDPWPADEPRFALIAKEMVETGDWFFPHRASQLYADKPPIFLWSVATVYAATGSIRLAHLLPSLLASLMTLAVVYLLGRRLWHRRAGLGAGLALLLLIQFPAQAKTGQMDAMVTLWTTLGLYGLCRHLLAGPDWRAYSLGFFAMGLGVITKGVGFLPMLVLIPWAFAALRGWPGLPRIRSGGWRWWLGPIFFLAAICLWLLPMLSLVETSDDPQLVSYRNEILWGQTAERYTSLKGHQKPLWFYPGQVIPSLWMPLVLFLPWLVPAWWRRLRRRDPRYLMLLVWIGLIVLFFTFSSGKRGVYILPATPALALLIGPLAAGLERLPGVRRTASAFVGMISTILLAAAGSGWAGAQWAVDFEQRQGLRPWGLLAALGLVGIVCLLRLRARSGVAALAGFFFCTWLLYGWWGYPLLNPVRSPAALMQRVAEHIGPHGELALVGWKEQLILHADRPVTHWGFVPDHLAEGQVEAQAAAAADWLTDSSESRWLLTSEAWLTPCFEQDRAADLGIRHRRRWFLVDRSALSGTCHPADGQPRAESLYRTSWVEPSASGLHQVARDDHALHLARAFINRRHPDVAVETRDLVVFAKAVAAMDLERLDGVNNELSMN